MKYYKLLDRIIVIFLGALVFTVPLYFAFLYKDYSVFTVDKTAIFQILVDTLFVLTLLKLLLFDVFNKAKEIKSFQFLKRFICFKKPLIVVGIFFIAFLISVIFSDDFYQSFWGSYWRKQGLVAYVHYFLFFLILVLNVDNYKKIQKIISASLIGSLIVSILGILQWLGYDPLPWQEKIPIFGRITSTMGQPIFLANYLLFLIPITIYRIIDCRLSIVDLKQKMMSQSDTLNSPFEGGGANAEGVVTTKQNTNLICPTLYIVLLILQLTALMFTYTRGAIIGLVLGILFFAFFYPIVIKKSKKALFKSIALFLLFIFLAIFFVMYTRGGWNYSDRIYWRMKNITDLEHGSTALRIKYWKSGLDALLKKPLLGYGPENQQSVLVKYYDATWIPYEKIGLIPDRAHNEYLDMAMSGGLLLFFAYLFMLFYVFVVGLKAIYLSHNEKRKKLIILILSALFSYIISSFFAFSVGELNIFLFFLIALVLLLSASEQGEALISLENDADSEKKIFIELKKIDFSDSRDRIVVYSFVLILPAIIFLIFQNINMVRADYHFREAREAYVDGQYLDMYENYIQAFRLNKKERYYKQSFVDDAMFSMFRVDSPGYKEAVTEYIKEFLSDYDGDTFYQLQERAKIYSLLGRFSDKKYLESAEEEYKKVVSMSSFLPNDQMGLAQVCIEKKDYLEAIKIYEHTLSFLPKLDSKQLNLEHRKEVEKLIAKINLGIEYCNNQLEKD